MKEIRTTCIMVLVSMICVFGIVLAHNENNHEYPGLSSYLETPYESPLNIVLVHGMSYCSPQEQLAETCDLLGSPNSGAIKTIVEGLGWDSTQIRVAEDWSNNDNLEYLQSTNIKIHSNEIRHSETEHIIFHDVNYSAYLTSDANENPYQDFSTYNKSLLWEADEFANEARKTNQDFKRNLITWGLADATIYLNQTKRNIITRDMATAITDIYDNSSSNVVFITFSLGSRVLFDSLMRFYDPCKYDTLEGNENSQTSCPSNRDRIFENRKSIYMMANQLALLELGIEGSGASINEIIATIPTEKELYLVAFSDVNDLLTYPTEFLFSTQTEELHVIDQEVSISSNIATIPWPFNVYLNNPLEAHNNHLESKDVVKMLIDGK